MALKDLFGKTSEQIVTKQQLDQLYQQAESEGYLEESLVDKERFLSAVDFSSASNFARFGSAERYYVDAFKNIYENYPYDGSKKEKLEWRNASSQLDLYIFDNVYPRTTGYLNLNSGTIGTDGTYRTTNFPQYVKIKGGPNQSPNNKFETANIYDLDTNRESNLGITSFGNTVEFWFKDNLNNTSSAYDRAYALFDLWNGQAESANEYTRLVIAKDAGSNTFSVTYRSGSNGVVSETLSYTFDSSVWHHYAFSFSNTNTNDLEICLYVDGDLTVKKAVTGGGGIGLGYNLNSIAHIGALRADITTANASKAGYGVSCGSFDEVRFWKVARNSQQIYRNWFTQVGGGSNTDDANKDLGIYLKFNEGVVSDTTISDLDKICLDSSGRVSNGSIVNYSLTTRNTGSAIDEYYNKKDLNDNLISIEAKDPIIFSTNPLVQSVIKSYSDLGFQYDNTNVASIYRSIPSWITEEAEKGGFADLQQLIQIISSYFDTLYIQIEAVNKIKNIEYVSNSKPKPFAKNLLSASGFENLEIFNDTTFLEEVLSRNESSEFEDKIHNVKNTIYQNIYNNLAYIYKSKGTEKSLRNLIRCFGIDDELVKINVYANNVEYDLSTKYTYTSIPKKFVDFNDPDRHAGYIIQKAKDGDSNTKSFIPGTLFNSASYIPITLQAEVIFPKNPIIETDSFFNTDITKVSLFGVHEASTDPEIYGWGADLFNFQVYAIKPKANSEDVYFKMSGSFNGIQLTLTSSLYKEVYANEKWNLAVRIKTENYGQTALTVGSDTPNYVVEFIGINSTGDSVNNSFSLSETISNADMVAALKVNKRIYAGAHYSDYDPDELLERTDVKISSIKFWLDYLNDDELLAHSYEANNFGRQQPNWMPAFYDSFVGSQAVPLTRMDMLALHWNFFNVTSSDSSGEFIVEDASSGSADLANNTFGYYWLNDMIRYQMPGYGKEFYPNDTQVVNKEYVFSGKKQNPETLNSNDMVQVVATDDVRRTKENKLASYYISIEKSMAQVINDEIMNWFATIDAFNNLIGQSKERYKEEYSELKHMRELFFARVGNSMDFEKFFNFYKWIDSSLSMMINQLIPASANASDKVRNMVENHMLLRDKYANKLPTIELKSTPKSSPVTSHLEYNYIEQAAGSVRLDQPLKVSRYYTFNPQWLKQRAIRTESPVDTVLQPQNDADREIMRQVINEKNLDSLPILYEIETNSTYSGREDLSRIFTKLYKFTTDKQTIIEDVILPINIQNIPVQGRFIFADEVETSSSTAQVIPAKQKYNRIGNYQHVYEPVFIPGRTNNNKSFVELEGNITGSTTVDIYDFPSRTLPVRQPHKNIIVERFSAPGGPEVNSRGYLDAAAEEFSVYNSLNYRNSRVRKVLNIWLAESASINTEYPSYHQVNKNASYSPNPETGLREADYDNWFVQHQIPQSDQQYAWITASLSSSFSGSGYMSEFTNLTPNYNFLDNYEVFGINLPFVNYRMFGNYLADKLYFSRVVDTASNTIYKEELTTAEKSGIGDPTPFVIMPHTYLSSVNGPYEAASWKILRSSENPLVISSRKNNNILVQDKPSVKTRLVNIPGGKKVYETYYPTRESTFTAYREPPITYNKPIEHKVIISGSLLPIEIVSTYDNNKNYFGNDDLNNRVGLRTRNDLQTYDILKSVEDEQIYLPTPNVAEVTYSAQIFPAKDKVGLKETRSKPTYAEVSGTGSNGYDRNTGEIRSFWRNDINDRQRSNEFESSDKTSSLNVENLALMSGSNLAESMRMKVRSKNMGGLFPSYGLTHWQTYYKDFLNRYDSIFSLDNDVTLDFAFDSITVNPASITAEYKIENTASIYGDLTGLDEFDLRELFKLPYGNYIYTWTTKSSGQFFYQEGFQHTQQAYYVRPKPSYTYNIYYPSCQVYSELDLMPLHNNKLDYRITNLVNMGMPFKTNIISGKNPWYDSYEEYFEDLRPFSINHTILPEFNFSENASYYIKDKNGDYKTTPPLNYLGNAGTDVEVNSIDNAYNISDKINSFLFKDYMGNNAPAFADQLKLKLNINGIKKLLPYKGFYPSERTAQLVDLFQKSFWDISNEDLINGYPTYAQSNNYGLALLGDTSIQTALSGSPLTMQMQTLLQPYFAPGILFNTIKAGIAMDWPTIYTSSIGTDTNLDAGPTYSPTTVNGLGASKGVPTFYVTSSHYADEMLPYNEQETERVYTIRAKNGMTRIPFESLIDLKGYTTGTSGNTLYYLDPTRVSLEHFSDTSASTAHNGAPKSTLNVRYNPQFGFENINSDKKRTNTFLDNRYTYAINNFLSETPNFFLKDSKLTSFTATKPANALEFEIGKTYEMYLKIEKDEDFKMILDATVPYYKMSSSNGEFSPIMGVGYAETARISAASLFGPPTQYMDSSSLPAIDVAHRAYDAPAFAPYAPPYFYGPQIVKFKFTPQKANGYNSYGEIINSLTVSCEPANDEMINQFSSSISGAGGTFGDTWNVITASTAYANRMPLTSSIKYNIIVPGFDKTQSSNNSLPITITDRNDPSAGFWRIQTKFETPLLNFNNQENNNFVINETETDIQTATAGDYDYKLTSHLTKFGFMGMWSGYATASANSGVSLKIIPAIDSGNTRDLSEICGFTTSKKYIGQIAEKKQISEAVVMIPYTRTKNHRTSNNELPITTMAETIPSILGENGNAQDVYYFAVDNKWINNNLNKKPDPSGVQLDFQDPNMSYKALKNILANSTDNSILKTMKSMTEYVLPPHLDWVYNRDIKPFVMYIFEFNHELTKEELADIWQGVMPQSAMWAKKDSISLEHNFSREEFFHGKMLPDDIQWKVFKIKKRANYSYNSLVDGQEDRLRKIDDTDNLAFSYNWPYDYFSLVELVNIDVGLEVNANKISYSNPATSLAQQISSSFTQG